MAESLSTAGCHPIVTDVGSIEAEEVIAVALDTRGEPLDLLVNNAGSIRKLRGLALTEAGDLEVRFRLRCTRAALPWLRQPARPQGPNQSSMRTGLE